nr:hypothetical protein [Tanacetum cinerariifolium]
MSPIHAFPIEDMYTPKFSDPFQENTTTWTREEEIALCKGWVDVSENNMLGNTRKDAGFWCAILQYLENKTKQYGRRTYDMINGKWKMVRPTVVRFRECTILKDSPKWMQSELPKFAAKSGGGSKRYKSSGSSSFNTESKKASINLNANVGDDEKDEEKEERLAFSDIKMREVECREQGVAFCHGLLFALEALCFIFIRSCEFSSEDPAFCLQRSCVLPQKHCVLSTSKILRFVLKTLRFVFKDLVFCLGSTAFCEKQFVAFC